MTLPAAPPISLAQVLAELQIANPGRATPVGLSDADVMALAGKVAAPVSLSDLLGKSAFYFSGVNYSDTQSNYQVRASVSFHPNGTVTRAQGGVLTNWGMPTTAGIGAGYEIMFHRNAWSGGSFGTWDMWMSMAAVRTVEAEQSWPTDGTANIAYTIRRAGSANVGSGTITLFTPAE